MTSCCDLEQSTPFCAYCGKSFFGDVINEIINDYDGQIRGHEWRKKHCLQYLQGDISKASAGKHRRELKEIEIMLATSMAKRNAIQELLSRLTSSEQGRH